jgi:tetratricopeptide (TPR) repeat protein
MSIAIRFFAAILLAALFLSPVPSGADDDAGTASSADDRSARLDGLFSDLMTAKGSEARAIEQKIWGVWLESGDAEVDSLMTAMILAMNSRSFGPALAFANKIVTIKPDFAEGWNKRATLYYIVKDFNHSIADIEATLALEPRHFGALSGLGMIMMQIGDKRRAIAAFRKALEVNPTMDGIRDTVSALEKELSRDL